MKKLLIFAIVTACFISISCIALASDCKDKATGEKISGEFKTIDLVKQEVTVILSNKEEKVFKLHKDVKVTMKGQKEKKAIKDVVIPKAEKIEMQLKDGVIVELMIPEITTKETDTAEPEVKKMKEIATEKKESDAVEVQ